MNLFIKKKKGNLEEQGFHRQPKNRFNETIEKNKIKIAGWLGKKTERYSTAQKRTGLVIFCALFAFLFMLLLGSSLRRNHFTWRTMDLIHPGTGVRGPLSDPAIDSVRKKVEMTGSWLDSLRKTDTAKFKAILLSKPYLLENLRVLEQLYHIQSN
jgi:hypothetical protein